jgi:hypothetical protein
LDAPRVTAETCQKCEFGGVGGTEEPCVPLHQIRKIQEDPSRVCPRVRLLPENEVAAEVAWFAVKLGGDHPLFRHAFDLQTQDMDASSRLSLFYRVIGAVSDEGIAARIKAARKRALSETE